eukprot:COSAG05_NODE_503_length_9211_cov_44.051361_2_plen_152_part_00
MVDATGRLVRHPRPSSQPIDERPLKTARLPCPHAQPASSSAHSTPAWAAMSICPLCMAGGAGLTVEEIDGTLEDCKEKRGELFKISGKSAVYPQIFIELEEGGAGPKFVGDWCRCFSLLLACAPSSTLIPSPMLLALHGWMQGGVRGADRM